MDTRITIAKRQNLNWQAIIIEEAQTQIKVIVRNAIMGVSGYSTFAQMRAKIKKTIREAVAELESADLKKIVSASLERFAEQLIGRSMVAMGIPTNLLITYYGLFKSGMTMPSIAKQVSQQINKNLQPLDVERRALPIATAGDMYDKEYRELVKPVYEQLISAEPMYDERISLRNIAEMTVRYERTSKSIEDLKASGVNLVQSSQHANCSKRCEKWQGGYYTLDDTYQVVDGITFQPLSNATDQYYTTRAGKTYKNGHITGYNCRHYLRAYRKGYSMPMVSAEEVAKQREIDHKMRYLERQIRKWKDSSLIYKGDARFEKQYLQAVAKTKYWNKTYIDYAKANKRAFYPSRTDVF